MNAFLFSLDDLKILIPVAVAVIGWILNEHSKRRWEEYQCKEDRYITLAKSLTGFYRSTELRTSRGETDEFLRQLNLSWLYCPDVVMEKACKFLELVREGAQASDEQMKDALGEFVLEVREPLNNLA